MNEISAFIAVAAHQELWVREQADPTRRHRRHALDIRRATRRRRR